MDIIIKNPNVEAANRSLSIDTDVIPLDASLASLITGKWPDVDTNGIKLIDATGSSSIEFTDLTAPVEEVFDAFEGDDFVKLSIVTKNNKGAHA